MVCQGTADRIYCAAYFIVSPAVRIVSYRIASYRTVHRVVVWGLLYVCIVLYRSRFVSCRIVLCGVCHIALYCPWFVSYCASGHTVLTLSSDRVLGSYQDSILVVRVRILSSFSPECIMVQSANDTGRDRFLLGNATFCYLYLWNWLLSGYMT
jgi:hypothetical protein